jgi:hypothetical protein
MQIRDRIKEFRRVRAADLRPNPKNWKTHPDRQRDALRGLLAEIGFAGAVLARELEGGSLELIDGHLRAETTPEMLLPVLVLDVTAEEADKLLATFDPLGDMAEPDDVALDDLLKGIDTENDALKELLEDLRTEDDEELPDEEEWSEAIDSIPDGDHPGIQQMTFTLSTAQAETVKEAIDKAKGDGDFGATGNPNDNGNALARIAGAYLGCS